MGQAARNIDLSVNSDKSVFMYFNQGGAISSPLNDKIFVDFGFHAHTHTHTHTNTHLCVCVILYSLIDQVVCFPHLWSQCASILFLIAPFFAMLVWINRRFHLSGSLPSDYFRPLRYHLTTARIHLLSVSLHDVSSLMKLLHSALESTRFWYAYAAIFPAWIFPIGRKLFCLIYYPSFSIRTNYVEINNNKTVKTFRTVHSPVFFKRNM